MNARKKTAHLTLDRQGVDEASNTIQSWLEEASLPERDILRIRLTMEEILSVVCEHGNESLQAELLLVRLFGEYRDEINADVCIFIPDGVPGDDPVIQNAAGLGIPDYAGRSWEPEVEIIHYHGRKTGFYIFSAEDSLLTFVENPIVVYVMRTPDEIGASLTDTHKASAAGNIAFRTDDAMLRDLQARDNIRCEIIPIGDTVQREFDSVKRICSALALICAVFIALNVFVSGFLIRMEYRLRAKKYCIKTVLGFMQKFGSFLTMSVLSILVSIVLVVLLRNQLHIQPTVLALICGGMLIADTVTIFAYAIRTERSSIVNSLKGGAL